MPKLFDNVSRRLRRNVPSLLTLGLFAIAVAVLHHAVGGRSYAEIGAQLVAIPTGALVGASILTLVSYFVLTGHDVVGLQYAGKPLRYRKIAFASFVSYAFANNLGASSATGGLLRYRIYAPLGLGAVDVARVALSCALSFWTGFLLLAGVAFIVSPPLVGSPLSHATTVWLGVIFLVLLVAYFIASVFARGPITLRGWRFVLPDWRISLAQLIVGVFDWAAAAAVFYAIMPASTLGEAIPFATVLGVFLLAQVAGVISHVPGGIGVFESLILVVLGPSVPTPALLAALVAYRAVYYLLPLAVAAVLLAGHELTLHRDAVSVGFRRAHRWMAVLAPPSFAVLSFVCGAALLFSGATPPLQHRITLLKTILPVGVVEASHFFASLLGAALLVVSRGLLLRLDAAWHAAVAIVVAATAMSLAKGLDFEEAAILLVLLVALLPCKRFFYRRSTAYSHAFTPQWVAAIVAVLGATVWLTFFAYRDIAYNNSLWWQFSFSGNAPRSLRALVGVAGAASVLGLGHMLRVSRYRPTAPSPEDLARAHRIAAESGRSSAHLALLGDKSILFSREGEAMLMFGVHGRSWVSMGDPIGPPRQCKELAWTFTEMCEQHATRPVFYQVTSANLPLYLELGLTPLKLGEEAMVSLTDFSLEGKSRKRLRATVRRAEAAGCRFEVLSLEQTQQEMATFKAISDAWMADKRAVEKGFSLGFFDPIYLARTPAAVVRVEGEIVAFANLWPARAGTELSVDLMRQRTDTPTGTMDYLFAQLMLWGRDAGYTSFNLGMAPLSGFAEHQLAPMWDKVGAFVFRHGESIYRFGGLRKYKEKFHPEWQPRYLAAPGGLKLPRVIANVTALISAKRPKPRRPRAPRVSPALLLPALLLPALLFLALVLPLSTPTTATAATFRYGAFGRLSVERPKATPKRIFLFVSGDGGWDKTAAAISRDLATMGALVVGINLRSYRRSVARSRKKCVYSAAHFEALSHWIQRRLKLPAYIEPVLVGHSAGATLAYAVLAQAPVGTFRGAISLSFDPVLAMPKPLCNYNGLRTSRVPKRRGQYRLLDESRALLPWTALHGGHDAVSPPGAAKDFTYTDPKGNFVLLPSVGHGFGKSRQWLGLFGVALGRIETTRKVAPLVRVARAAVSKASSQPPRSGAAGVAGQPARSPPPNAAGAVGRAQRPRVAAPTPPKPGVASATGPYVMVGPQLPPALPNARVNDLPLVPVPSVRPGQVFAILLTGDGGWAGFDRDLAAKLASRGVPVVGLNALKYFWKRKTRAQGAADLARIIGAFSHRWGRDQVILIGYSLGADALPVLMHSLSPTARRYVRGLVLLGPGRTFDLEFHVGNWLGAGSAADRAVLPYLRLNHDVPVVCAYGSRESASLCQLRNLPKNVKVVRLRGGHHLGGDYAKLAELVMGVGLPPGPAKRP